VFDGATNVSLISVKGCGSRSGAEVNCEREGVTTMSVGVLRWGLMLVTVVWLVSSGLGCCSGDMKKFDVAVHLNENTKDASGQYPAVNVDLVGVTPSELARYTDYSMTKYWQQDAQGAPDNQRAGATKFAMTFTGPRDTQLLPNNDPIWEAWNKQGARYLFVMSSYPRTSTDQPGEKDTRRTIIPLDCARWDRNTEKLDVEIGKDGVKLLTQPKPEQH
jgi:hypothetical protein